MRTHSMQGALNEMQSLGVPEKEIEYGTEGTYINS